MASKFALGSLQGPGRGSFITIFEHFSLIFFDFLYFSLVFFILRLVWTPAGQFLGPEAPKIAPQGPIFLKT